ncbi:MAG: SDR family oxidoreductase [Chloroflexota bacterium]|nr:SDR family oxidoreductase [Chloroflexota bacterium]
MELDGKVALITGAASGMGRAAAIQLAANGARVFAADLNAAGAEETRIAISQAGGEAIACRLDVSDSAEVDGAVKHALERFGQIDVLVHCAGVGGMTPVIEMTDDTWRRILAINLDGSFYVSRAVARAMIGRGAGGTMILIASGIGQQGMAGNAHYAASKGGVIALMKSLALELGRHNITVNAINPGRTETPFLTRGVPFSEEERRRHVGNDPLGKLSQPEDIAETILFLASRGGKYMTGQLVTTRMP